MNKFKFMFCYKKIVVCFGHTYEEDNKLELPIIFYTEQKESKEKLINLLEEYGKKVYWVNFFDYNKITFEGTDIKEGYINNYKTFINDVALNYEFNPRKFVIADVVIEDLFIPPPIAIAEDISLKMENDFNLACAFRIAVKAIKIHISKYIL